MLDDATGNTFGDTFGDTFGNDADARLALAREVLAPRVRELTLRWFQSRELATERKADGSVVTPVDREGEDLIRSILAREFSEDAILGEERGETPGAHGNRWRWVLDPIDGTGSFVRGLPHWVLLVGIEHDGAPVAGLIDAPVVNERVWAVRGGGAHWRLRNGETRPARVSTTASIDKAMIEIGPATHFRSSGHAAVHTRLCQAARRTRGWSDGSAFALLATGRVDAAVNFGFHRWDLCAPAAIIAEAGGRMSDWSGGGDSLEAREIVVSNAALHDEIVRLIQG